MKLKKNRKTIIQDEPEQTNYASVMDGIVKTLEEKDSYEEALPLLKDLAELQSAASEYFSNGSPLRKN